MPIFVAKYVYFFFMKKLVCTQHANISQNRLINKGLNTKNGSQEAVRGKYAGKMIQKHLKLATFAEVMCRPRQNAGALTLSKLHLSSVK